MIGYTRLQIEISWRQQTPSEDMQRGVIDDIHKKRTEKCVVWQKVTWPQINEHLILKMHAYKAA